PQRFGLAPRQLADRAGIRAIRPARRGRRDRECAHRGRPSLSFEPAARALVRVPARSAVLISSGGLPRVVHPAGLVRGHGVPLPARAARYAAGPQHAAPPPRSGSRALASPLLRAWFSVFHTP